MKHRDLLFLGFLLSQTTSVWAMDNDEVLDRREQDMNIARRAAEQRDAELMAIAQREAGQREEAARKLKVAIKAEAEKQRVLHLPSGAVITKTQYDLLPADIKPLFLLKPKSFLKPEEVLYSKK